MVVHRQSFHTEEHQVDTSRYFWYDLASSASQVLGMQQIRRMIMTIVLHRGPPLISRSQLAKHDHPHQKRHCLASNP